MGLVCTTRGFEGFLTFSKNKTTQFQSVRNPDLIKIFLEKPSFESRASLSAPFEDGRKSRDR